MSRSSLRVHGLRVLDWLGLLLLIWVQGSLVGSARADGKVFAPERVPQEVAMPDQRALLAWHEGMQTLAIESAFVGKGTDFAWVVPLPSKPEVAAADAGLLSATAAGFLPQVERQDAATGIFFPALGLGLFAMGVLSVGWRGWRLSCNLLSVAGVLTAVGGMFLMVSPWFLLVVGGFMIFLARSLAKDFGGNTSLSVSLVCIITMLLVAMMIPTFGKVRGAAGAESDDGGVHVERSIVGDYEVAVLSGPAAESVVGWLAREGFALDAASRGVATEHAAAGGWFVASRVRREWAESARSVPRPLVFRFPTPKPIYPMKLTGAGRTEPLRVDLYVFGPGRAAAMGSGLKVRSASPVEVVEARAFMDRPMTWLREGRRLFAHPEIHRWARGTVYGTHLSGAAVGEALTHDWELSWGPAEGATGLIVYAQEDAWLLGAALGAGVLLLVSIIAGLRLRGARPGWRWLASGLVLAALATVVTYAALPTVAVKEVRRDLRNEWLLRADQRQVATVFAIDLMAWEEKASAEAAAAFDLEKARELLAKTLKTVSYRENDPTRSKTGIGTAPGEVDVVRLASGEWRVYFYEANGAAVFVPDAEVLR
jgi:hypothetical protein